MTEPLDDQLLAAELQAMRGMARAADRGGGDLHADPRLPDWVRVFLRQHQAAFNEGRSQVCEHLRDVPVQPIWSAAHLPPGLAVCQACVHILDEIEQQMGLPWVCAGCGRGDEDGADIAIPVLRRGLLLLMLRTCEVCRAEMTAAAADFDDLLDG